MKLCCRLAIPAFFAFVTVGSTVSAETPNVVILYADDMGYGDLGALNPESKIPTPNLDKLAAEGVLFTDAHSSGTICTPSRYGLLTGTYHWRKFTGIVPVSGHSKFGKDQLTMAKMLQEKGYTTACIGKWHLGWDWQSICTETDVDPARKLGYKPAFFDWSQPIPDGPIAHGFDYYFGDDVPNFPPYTWIENDRVLTVPTERLKLNPRPREGGPKECRPGPMAPGWRLDEVMPTMTRKAVEWIGKQKGSNKPFFLYFSWTSPHTPIVPTEEFLGKTGAGDYGDFVMQGDAESGQILEALDRNGFRDNTIVIFTSDNGAEGYAKARITKTGHNSSGILSGTKRSLLEGGHRLPFVIRWPGLIKAGTVSDALVSQTDIMATLAEITGYELPDTAAKDSFSMLPLLKGRRDEWKRTSYICSYRTTQGIRDGDWVMINITLPYTFKDGSMDMDSFSPNENWNTRAALYNLKDDISQKTNVIKAHPEVAERLYGQYLQLLKRGHSAPRLTGS